MHPNLPAFVGEVHVLRQITGDGRFLRDAVDLDNAQVDASTRALRARTIELERSVKDLDSFAYSIAHDLRAPLRAIDGFSQIVLDDLGPVVDPETHRHLEIIRSNAQGMQLLIDGLLDLCRLGQKPIEPRELVTAEVVRRAIHDLGMLAKRPDVEITIDPLPSCTADPTLLRQVFVNLIDNALKFTSTRSDARVHIGSTTTGRNVTYFVKDNGVGFDPRQADKVFGVFRRLQRVEDFEGTGIGLALVQRIVERHGGRVWCEGSIDEGARFFFTLGGESDE